MFFFVVEVDDKIVGILDFGFYYFFLVGKYVVIFGIFIVEFY